MIVLFNNHGLLGRLLVKEAIIRRKRSKQNEALNVANMKGEIAKLRCKPCEIIDDILVKPNRNDIMTR